MKKYFLFACVAAALVSCTSDEYVGEVTQEPATLDNAIKFASTANGMSRATHTGLAAASKLNLQFYVGGFKGGDINTPASVVATTVFDHYKVEWGVNSAGTTESNTSDWEYVGKGPGYNSQITAPQTVKYWDYSVGQYDFIAYSPSTATVVTDAAADGKLYVTPFTPATATSATNGAYTVTGATAELEKFYIADLVTAYNPAYTSAPTTVKMGKEVTFNFRNLTSKVRIGLYETVPGYSIRDVEFYASDAADAGNETEVATLYTSDDKIYSKGTYTVYYPTVDKNMNDDGVQASDYNKAHVAFAPATTGGATSTVTFGDGSAELTYTRDQASTNESGEKYLGTSSNEATYITADKAEAYTTVLPNEGADALTLRCNYTLVSDDGSKETIKVWGAKAVVPAKYCQWKSNYAYTYLFKISDNTNGKTQALGMGTEGLTPITFDAVVAETEDGIQETVTTVATPSITTYSPGVQPTANNEYKAGNQIYVMVQQDAALKGDLGTNGHLFTVAKTGTADISEATVMDALQMGTSADGVITGRNGITLTAVNSLYNVSSTEIPGADGNKITVTAGQVADFTASANTYAYVYDFTTGSPTETIIYSATVLTTVPGDWSTSLYFKDPDGNTPAPADFVAGTYYKKFINNGRSYAVKVIKVAE